MPDETQNTGVDDQRDADVSEHQEESTTPDDLGDKGKAALKAERDRAKAAEREAQQLRDEIAKRDKDAVEARQKEAAEQGKWKELAEERESNLATVQQERDGLASEADALRTYFTSEYTAAVKDLPDVIRAFAPADDAPFTEKSAWLTKAKAEAAKVEKLQSPGNRPNPAAATGDFDLQAEIAKARASGKYRA